VKTDDLEDGAVTTAKLADGAVTSAKIADNAVTSAKIADGTITNIDISSTAAIAVSKLAPGANGQVLMTVSGTPQWSTLPGMLPSGSAANQLLRWSGTSWVAVDLVAVTGGGIEITHDGGINVAIADNGVTNAKLADDAVTSDKIKDGEVTNDDLDGAVTTDPRCGHQRQDKGW
jgi:hypothetical protein